MLSPISIGKMLKKKKISNGISKLANILSNDKARTCGGDVNEEAKEHSFVTPNK